MIRKQRSRERSFARLARSGNRDDRKALRKLKRGLSGMTRDHCEILQIHDSVVNLF
jgi:hypothetical protein